MGMMLGCSSLAAVRASRWKRSTNSLSKAREKGSTLIATSRSSCFSRARKTMAMPPRPSSWRISYSSLSWSRTMSISVRSIPQDRQNLKCSSFWVPQLGQYIPAPEGRAVTYGPPRRGVNLRGRDHLKPPRPDEDAAGGGISQPHREHVLPAPDATQIDAAVHARRRPVGDGVEGEQHRWPPPAEQSANRPEQRRPAELLHPHLRMVRGPALQSVHLVVELGYGAFGETAQGVEQHGVVRERPEEPRARPAHHDVADGEVAAVQRLDRQRVTAEDLARVAIPAGDEQAVAVQAGRDGDRHAAREVRPAAQGLPRGEHAQRIEPAHDVVAAVGDEQPEMQRVEDALAARLRGEFLGRDREHDVELLPRPRARLPTAHDEIVDDEVERDGEALAIAVGRGAEPDGAMPAFALLGRAAHPHAGIHGVQVRARLPERRAVARGRRPSPARALKA